MSNSDADAPISEAMRRLRAGQLVAFPTETVYGLGADAADADAVLSIFEAKGRPRFNPLIVHCADLAMAETLVSFNTDARRLRDMWPGPLTLVLPRRPDAPVADLVSAGLSSLAVRIPAHPLARRLIAETGRPLAAPSANPSGRLSPTSADQVAGLSGNVLVLDGGPCTAGLESTIIACLGDDPVQLRAGAVPLAEIEAQLGRPIGRARADSPVAAPGMLKSHYAPNAPLRLDAEAPEPDEAFLAFGDAPGAPNRGLRNLSPTGDLREAARNLFAFLHQLDDMEAKRIAVAPIPETGLGEAINDRLRRAAAPRS